ncbi:MAG: GAF domain-containing protein [Thermodesulfobacteriota bacterium]
MPKPSYGDLERRVQQLEGVVRDVLSSASDTDRNELFELAVLVNVAEAVGRTRDLDQLLSVVIEEVCKALIAEGAGVLLYDDNRGDLYFRKIRDTRNILAPQISELRLPIDGSIAGWVFKNNKAARVNDTATDPRYYPEMTKRSGFSIRKVLQVPLNTGDKTIGVLMIMNKIGGDFSELDEALATSMGVSIALAIDNATVYEKLKKSRDDLEMLYRASMAIASTLDLDHLLEVVVRELIGAMETEAAGILLYDERCGDLYWKEVQDERGELDKLAGELRLPLDASVSGRVYRTGEPAMLNDPCSDPEFFRPFETRSGFLIRNEVIVPLNTREGTIGVLAVMNKRHGRFTEADVHVCLSLAGVVALAVENANFFTELMNSYGELEALNRAKTKILNHLSHELRTPLAIIRGSVATMRRKLTNEGITGFERAIDRIERHVQSLNRLEAQVESIMMTGYSWEKRMISSFLQCALDLMAVQAERTPEITHASEVIHHWLEKTFPTYKDEPDLIDVKQFGDALMVRIRDKAAQQKRLVNLTCDLQSEAQVLIPTHVLESVIEGLVRNAIEATPDHGKVTVTGRRTGNRYVVSVKDTGIGIPEKDKVFIFEGFYHVQDTDDYSSGRQYSFNAGGKGVDLLRIRMFSEIYGFKLSFTSKRCPHLEDSAPQMPGDASECPHCAVSADCERYGGTEFVVDFPLADKDGVIEERSTSIFDG